MDEIVQKSDRLIELSPKKVERDSPGNLNWNWRLNAILGARGTGKTTLLLQRAARLKSQNIEVLYISLDDLYFTEHRLIEVATKFSQSGGRHLYIDEVHKYPGWARELKNVYDSLPDLKVVFSGSSILEIFRQDVDLSRRALVYELPGLSFREFLAMAGIIVFEKIQLETLLKSHREIALEILQKIKPLQHFNRYLRRGYYPFFLEEHRDYVLTLEQVIKLVIENDLQYLDGFDISYSRKMLQLLKIIAGSPPFKPNISKLSERIGINRNTLVGYFRYLERARLVSLANFPEKNISALQKPDKVFLNNPNLYYVLNPLHSDIGSIRESFFFNQTAVVAQPVLHPQVDFMVVKDDISYHFEVGGAGKSAKQSEGLSNAFIIKDDIESGMENRIPLWLFGFLY